MYVVCWLVGLQKSSSGILVLQGVAHVYYETIIPPKMCAAKIIGRLLVCSNLSTVVMIYLGHAVPLSKHRLDTRDLTWS